MPVDPSPDSLLQQAARLVAAVNRPLYALTADALHLQADDHFLEIGFGSGVFIDELAGHVRAIAGVERAAELVTAAAARNQARLASGQLQLVCGDAAPLPFPSDHFDAAALIETVGYLAAPAVVLAEVRRVLKPGGRLVLSFNWSREESAARAAMLGRMGVKLYGRDELCNLLKSVGFHETTVRLERTAIGTPMTVVLAIKAPT